MDLGEPQREWEVSPVEEPVPREQPAPEREQRPVEAPDGEPVPA